MKTSNLLYRQIFDHLTEKIMNNELLPYQQLPTEMELAQQFNVSRITSRRALIELEEQGWIIRARGKGSTVKPRPDHRPVSSPQSAMNNVIAMIIPRRDENQRLLDYVLGASEYLSSQGYGLSIYTSNGKADTERELLYTLPNDGAKGIIFYPQSINVNLDLLHTLYAKDYPLVTIDKFYDVPLSYVISDNFNGSYLMTSHLIGLGHRKIAFASRKSLESASSLRNRFSGYCQGLKENGLEINSELVATHFETGFAGFPNLLDFHKHLVERFLQQGVTAIQAANDTSAVLFLKACKELGIQVPDQLSITGFDNIEIAEHLEIPLTTVAQDFKGIGRKAAEIVIRTLDKGVSLNEQAALPVELIVRKSTQ